MRRGELPDVLAAGPAGPPGAAGRAGLLAEHLATTSPILVTGGTGTLGRLVVQQLGDAGRDVRVLSRRGPRSQAAADGVDFVTGDLVAGTGIDPAVDGVSAIVHCASDNKGDAEATRNLVAAATASGGKPHLVYISIVGADRVTFGYVRAKLEAEQIVTDSGLPWTTLRATQFYDLILNGTQKLARLPMVPVPAGFPTQPVDAGEVAARLAELTLGSRPAGCPTWPGRRYSASPTWSAVIFGPQAAGGRCCPCGCPGSARSGTAR